MVVVKITSKIEEKINEYVKEYGSNKSWISRKIGYNSRQAMDSAIKAASPTLETYAKFAFFFKCNITDLFEIEVHEKD